MMISSVPLTKHHFARSCVRRPLPNITRKSVVPRASVHPLGIAFDNMAHAFTFGVFIYTTMNYVHYKNLVKKKEDTTKPPKKK